MFYLAYGTKEHLRIHRQPLKFKFDRKKKILTGPFNSFADVIEHSSNEGLVFGIWREIIEPGSYGEMDFETTERNINLITPTICPAMVETFTYNMSDCYICADAPTAIITGDRSVNNSLVVYIKRNDKTNYTDVSHISFQIKLN
jgi:hypothetical protein